MSSVKNIPYGTPLHRKILDAVIARRKLSNDKFISERGTKWKEAEELFLAYLPTTENDALKKVKRQGGKPQYTTIEVPYSFAIMMTAHTYLSTVFLSRNPIMQFSGRHGEAAHKTRSIEAVLDYQRQVGEMTVPLYIWLYDALKYGVGIVGSYWAEESEIISRIEEQTTSFFGIDFGTKRKVRITERVQGYQGNRIFNVRPFNFYPDPRLPLSELQRGEFCGRDVEVSWNDIVKGQQAGRYFNIEQVKRMRQFSQDKSEDGSSQMNLPKAEDVTSYPSDITDMGYVQLHEMTIELIPQEWGLGNQKDPIKWVFTIANLTVIISAQPLGLYHNKFPFFTMEPELNGYSQVNRGMLESTKPLNDVMSWLINTHFYNVRKMLNDEVIVDPSRVEMSDVYDPGPGKVMRLKPVAYGQDVRTIIHQMQVNDVTRTHLKDAQIVAEMIQRATGVTDNIMGLVNPGGRKTATEVRSSSTFGINRLKTLAEYLSAQGFSKLATVLVQTTQQNYSQEQVFKVAGKLAFEAEPWVDVNPESIQGFFDFVPIDGTLPVDKFALVSIWKELMKEGAALQPVAMKYDFAKIFAYVAELAGVKNIDQFELVTVPDDELARKAEAGNTIPIGGPGGPGTSRSTAVTKEGASGTPQPRQVAGLGPSA